MELWQESCGKDGGVEEDGVEEGGWKRVEVLKRLELWKGWKIAGCVRCGREWCCGRGDSCGRGWSCGK